MRVLLLSPSQVKAISHYQRVRSGAEVKFRHTLESHALVHTARYVHHFSSVQAYGDDVLPAASADTLRHQCLSDASSPVFRANGQKADARPTSRPPLW